MSESLKHVAMAIAVSIGTSGACRDDGAEPPMPVSPNPPDGLETAGTPLFSLDVETPEYHAVFAGAPAGTEIIAKLRSHGGERTLILRTPAGEEEVAPAGWIPLASGAFSSAGHAVICWNVLVGKASPTGGMPHPRDGIVLRCRFLDGTLGDAQDVASGEWLMEMSTEMDAYTLLTYRDTTGWLYMMADGDTYLSRVSTGASFGAASEVLP